MNNFFLWCAGTDKDLLNQCTNSDRIKQFVLGILVLIPSVFAFISSVLFVSILFASCASYTSPVSKIVNKEAVKLNITNTGIVQKTVIVDLDVKERTRQEKTYEVPVIEQQSNPDFVESLKTLTVAELLKRKKADVLVEPRFEIETENEKVTVSVVGFPAEYINFRNIVPQDTLWMSRNSKEAVIYQPEKLDRTESKIKKQENQPKPNNNKKVILYTTLISILLIIIFVATAA